MKLENISEAQFDHLETRYKLVEVKCRGKVIWPLGFVYDMIDIAVLYSSGSALHPSRSNHATITGTLRKKTRGGVIIETTPGVEMSPYFYSGTNYYTISSNNIYFNRDSYGTTEISGRSDYFQAEYTAPDGTIITSSSLAVALIANQIITTTEYNGYYSYGRPSDPTIFSGITAGDSSAYVSSYVSDTWNYQYKYTSGDYTGWYERNEQGSVEYVLTTNYGGRFSLSGSTLYHDSMTTNLTTDTAGVKARNARSSSMLSSETTKSVTNSKNPWDGSSTDRDAKQYGTPTYEYGYYTASINANRYTSSSSACPASGGNCTLEWSATRKQRTKRDWTQDVYKIGTYTSGSPWRTFYYQDSDTEYSSWSGPQSVSVTPTITAPLGGFTRSGTTVSITSEGTDKYLSGRSALVSISNGDTSDSVTIYQDINDVESITYGSWGSKTITGVRTIDNQYTCSISSSDFTTSSTGCVFLGGTFDVLSYSASHKRHTETDYIRYRDKIEHYSSGAPKTIANGDSETGSDPSAETTITDTPILSIDLSPSWIYLTNDNRVVFRQSTSSSYRSATVRATNNSAQSTVTLYQQKEDFSQVVGFSKNIRIYVNNLYSESLVVGYTITVDGITKETNTVTISGGGSYATNQRPLSSQVWKGIVNSVAIA